MGNSVSSTQAKRKKTWQPKETNKKTKTTTNQPKGNTNAQENKENNKNVNNTENEGEPVRDNLGILVGNPGTRPNYANNHIPSTDAPMPLNYPQRNPYRVFPRPKPIRYDDMPMNDDLGPNVSYSRPRNRPLVYGSTPFQPIHSVPFQAGPVPYFHRHSYGASLPYSYHHYSTYPRPAGIYAQPRAYNTVYTGVPPVQYNISRPVTEVTSVFPPRTHLYPLPVEPVIVEHVPHQNMIPIENQFDDTARRPNTFSQEVPVADDLRTTIRPKVKVVMVKSGGRDRKRYKETVPAHSETNINNYKDLNMMFYKNLIKFRPDGEYIDYILKYWYGNYYLLDKDQSYIPWLFPISGSSTEDSYISPLRPHEAKFIRNDSEAHVRFVLCYKMMLDFYGFQLQDETTGKLSRSDSCIERLYHLNRSRQNQCHIIRILQSLGEVGLSQYQSPFVMSLLHEVFETLELSAVPSVISLSWLNTIHSDYERDYIYKIFYHWLHTMGKLHVLETKTVRDKTQYEKLHTFDKTLRDTYSTAR